MSISLQVNGVQRQIHSDPDTPLLWVLRDELGLPGTKFGCGGGYCGACTVHFNGAPIRSCSLPVEAAAGQLITTIEGLMPDGSLHPVQQAWIDHNVPQCGYCQSGQIMSAVALLQQNASPSNDEIRASMSGNLCRCGTYPRIQAALNSLSLKGAGQVGAVIFDPVRETDA